MPYRDVFMAVSEAMIPPGGAFPTGGGNVDLPGRLEKAVASFGRTMFLLKLFFLFVDVLPILTFFSLKRFRSLDIEMREAFLARLQHSRWIGHRMLFAGLRALVMLIFYSTPEAEKDIGYSTECIVGDK